MAMSSDVDTTETTGAEGQRSLLWNRSQTALGGGGEATTAVDDEIMTC